MKRYLLLLFIILCTRGYAQQDASLRVGVITLSFIDSSRQRPITTEVWFPTFSAYQDDDIKLASVIPFVRTPTVRNAKVISRSQPLVLFSHGFGGTRLSSEWFAARLAQKGFIVAAVDHWGNNFDNMVPDIAVRFLERPKDISFALTQLLNDGTFGPIIDTNRIAAAGFSMGGYTAIVLAGGEPDFSALLKYVNDVEGSKEFNWPELPGLRNFLNDQKTIAYYTNTPPTLKDHRIKAVLALCPALGKSYTHIRQVQRINIPVFIVGTAADSVTPVRTNAGYYHQLIRNSAFLLIPGKAGHYVMLNEANQSLKKDAPVHFEDDPSVNRVTIHQRIAEQAIDFFQKKLPPARY